MEFGIGNYVFHEVFLNPDATQFGVKEKLVLRCVEDIFQG